MPRLDKVKKVDIIKMAFAFFAMAIVLVGLSACGKDSAYVGKWKIESANMMGQDIATEELGALFLDVKSDGTCLVGDEIDDGPAEEYSWTEKDGKMLIALDIEGETYELAGIIRDGKLVFDEWLGLPAELVFKKS